MAVIDHLANGRFFAGFARGYQKRWTSILGQHDDVQATMSDGSAADSPAAARRILAAQDEEFYRNIYGSFFPFLIAGATDMVDRIVETGLFPCGTVDEQVAYWQAILDKVPCEYLCLIWHYAQAPKQSVIDELDLFMTKVLPRLKVPDFPDFDITPAQPLAAE